MNKNIGRIVVAIFALLILSAAAWGTTVWDAFYASDGYFTNNVTAKNIGGVIYADQYATIQDAINASVLITPHPEVYVPAGIYTLQTNYSIGGSTVGLYVYDGVHLRGAGNNTIIKQGAGVNSISMILLYGQGTSISDMTLDFNGNDQTYTGWGAGSWFHVIEAGIVGYPSSHVNIKNLNITNAFSNVKDGNTKTDAINLFDSAYANVENIDIYNFDSGITITWNVEDSTTDYFINNIRAFNGGIGQVIYWENGNAVISNVYSHNASVLDIGGRVNNGIIRNFEGVTTRNSNVRIGFVEHFNGVLENLNFDNATIVVGRTHNLKIINPRISNPTGVCIKLEGGHTEIMNPYLLNCNYGIQTTGDTYGKIIGGNISATTNSLLFQDTSRTEAYFINITKGAVSTVSGSTLFNNFGVSPFNFGKSAVPLTAFGAGDTYFNTSSNIGYTYTTSWQPDTQTEYNEEFTGTGSATAFSTTYSPIVTNSTMVFNGTGIVRYGAGAGKYTVNTTHIIFGTAPGNGEIIVAKYVV